MDCLLCFGVSNYTLTIIEGDLDEVRCDMVNQQDRYDYASSKMGFEWDVVQWFWVLRKGLKDAMEMCWGILV